MSKWCARVKQLSSELNNVFLMVNSNFWYIRWNGAGAFVGSEDGRKAGALQGLEIINDVLQHPQSTSNYSSGSDLAQVFGQVEKERSFGVGYCANSRSFSIESGMNDQERQNRKRHFDSGVDLIAEELPDFARYLRATIATPAPVPGGGAGWSYEHWRAPDDLLGEDVDWTFGHLDSFVPSRLDFELRREVNAWWLVRLGSERCSVRPSEGMDILAVLTDRSLAMSTESMAVAIGIASDPNDRPTAPELAGTMQKAKEFGPEMRQAWDHYRYHSSKTEISADATEALQGWSANRAEMNGIDSDDLFIPGLDIAPDVDDVPSLMSALVLTASYLKDAAVAEHVASGPSPKFKDLGGKLRRCEKLIAELRNYENAPSVRDIPTAPVVSVLQRRFNKSLRAAIADIKAQCQAIGDELDSRLTTKNTLLFINLEA
jgi:hypothetical protein